MDSLRWIDDELALLEQQRLLRRLLTCSPVEDLRIVVKGQTLLNFGSNDYLGLASDPRLIAAARNYLESSVWGSGASPLVTGHTGAHSDLEKQLADFEATEAALVFSSGFAANVGTITALVGHGDVIFSDAKNHASIIDGCRLSGAKVRVFVHGDMAHLEKLLAQASGFRRRLITTDSLFSMDGSAASLDRLVELAEQYEAMLMIDEAHATGIFGNAGRGLAEAMNVEDRIPIKVGTLSKALGCAGGFVAGSRRLIDWIANRARTYVFSTAQPAAGAAAASAALRIVQEEPHRRTTLLKKANSVRSHLQDQGWNTVSSDSQIIPILIGEPGWTMSLASRLREEGFFVPGIRPPSVPDGESLLRISLSYAHTDQQIETLVQTMGQLAR
jgi:8-amino-7-oxononanoate synthase